MKYFAQGRCEVFVMLAICLVVFTRPVTLLIIRYWQLLLEGDRGPMNTQGATLSHSRVNRINLSGVASFGLLTVIATAVECRPPVF